MCIGLPGTAAVVDMPVGSALSLRLCAGAGSRPHMNNRGTVWLGRADGIRQRAEHSHDHGCPEEDLPDDLELHPTYRQLPLPAQPPHDRLTAPHSNQACAPELRTKDAFDDSCGGLTFCTFVTYDSRIEQGPDVALSRSDAETIRNVVLRLRSEHADREAAAIERLMQQAIGSPDTAAALAGYMTTGEAASLIGVSLQTVKNWVGRGRLVGSRVGGRTLVTRASVQAFFDTLSSAPDEVESDDGDAAEVADRELMASLPESLVVRLETLLEQARSGQKLTPSERRELRRLAHAGTTAATGRTRDLVTRRRSA